MKGTLWGGRRSGKAGLDAELDAYTVGEDREWDRRLVAWDILGSLGHVEALRASGLVSPREHGRLRAALRRALADAAAGRLGVSREDEDVHSAVEKRLVAELGPLGEKLHTARSRNDQVLCDLRLYLKDRLLDVEQDLLEAVLALCGFAREHRRVVFPGFTHTRRAMPSTMGLWATGYASGLLDDLLPLRAARALVDRSPLGSAAGYGVPAPLDRQASARALGFADVQASVTAVQSGRGKLDVVVLSALWNVAHDLGQLACDVILFASGEHGYFTLAADVATGSSIMPHKRNPDLFELTRGRAALMEGWVTQAMALSGKLTSGYHRDYQLLKGPLMRGVDTVEEMLQITGRALGALGVDEERCRHAVGGELLATDEVFRRVEQGTPFRSAYRDVSDEVKAGTQAPQLTPSRILATRRHEGGAGNPGTADVKRKAEKALRETRAERVRFDKALATLAGRRGWR